MIDIKLPNVPFGHYKYSVMPFVLKNVPSKLNNDILISHIQPYPGLLF